MFEYNYYYYYYYYYYYFFFFFFFFFTCFAFVFLFLIPRADEGSAFLRNVGHPLPSDVVSYPTRMEFSTARP
jgi:hypothetical protein